MRISQYVQSSMGQVYQPIKANLQARCPDVRFCLQVGPAGAVGSLAEYRKFGLAYMLKKTEKQTIPANQSLRTD